MVLDSCIGSVAGSSSQQLNKATVSRWAEEFTTM